MRISSVVRGIENVVIGASLATAKRAKKAAHAAKIEVKAQQVAAQARAAERHERKLNKLSFAEMEAHRRDQRAIERRAHDLLSE